MKYLHKPTGKILTQLCVPQPCKVTIYDETGTETNLNTVSVIRYYDEDGKIFPCDTEDLEYISSQIEYQWTATAIL